MRVAILGCGPSGLLAAYAVELAGHQPTIFSRKVKSVMPGAMYIHEPIPGLLVDQPVPIKYAKLGTKQGYAKKVYGDPDAPCSWDQFPEGIVPGYDMVAAYNALWNRYEPVIVDMAIEPGFLANPKLMQHYDKVVSTIPAHVLCYGDCTFESRTVWIHKEHRDICEQLGDPCIIYNGQEQPYYRTSLLFGVGSTEYPNGGPPPPGRAVKGVKPIGTTCRCRPHIMRAGRFGTWQKGVLVHHVFKEVLHAVQ
jgi:hypothetical protein